MNGEIEFNVPTRYQGNSFEQVKLTFQNGKVIDYEKKELDNIKIEISNVKAKEKKILERMLQLYLHDISQFFPMDFDSTTGIYQYDDLDKYFDNADNYPYLIKSDDNIAGFMLIDKINDEFIMQEMFVLNNYKNQGVGKESVFKAFDKYNGKWIVKSLPCSPKAENFWHRTIKEYTNDNFKIEQVGRFNRAIFTFSMSDNND